jgi:dTDP-4-dehydrorhamnose reductase
LTQVDEIVKCLAGEPFDVLVNAAGLTSVDQCEERREEARLSNAVAPGILAEICRGRGKRMVHVSSDYVFDGQVHEPRQESDAVGPCNYYGQTKLEGEMAVLAADPGALVTRVSWLFGRDKPSFPDMIIEQSLKSSEVSAVNDKWSSPTYADDLAGWLLRLIERHPDVSGVLHLSNTGSPTWQEYGEEALRMAATLGVPVRTREVRGHSMEGFTAFIAKRPPYTTLDTSLYRRLTGDQPRSWESALEEYLRLKHTGI